MTATAHRRTFVRTFVAAATTRPFMNALLALKHQRQLLESACPPATDARVEPALAASKLANAA